MRASTIKVAAAAAATDYSPSKAEESFRIKTWFTIYSASIFLLAAAAFCCSLCASHSVRWIQFYELKIWLTKSLAIFLLIKSNARPWLHSEPAMRCHRRWAAAEKAQKRQKCAKCVKIYCHSRLAPLLLLLLLCAALLVRHSSRQTQIKCILFWTPFIRIHSFLLCFSLIRFSFFRS